MLFYTNPNNGKLGFRRLDAEVLMDDILCVEEIKTPEDMEWAVERLCGCIEEAVHDWYIEIHKKPDYYDHCNIEVCYNQEDYEDDEWIAGKPFMAMNVGCMKDYIDYTPRTLDEIMSAWQNERIKEFWDKYWQSSEFMIYSL